MMKRIVSAALALCLMAVSTASMAQSKKFEVGKNLQVQYRILNILSGDFVDSVSTDKLVMKGIEGMLSSLDPYTEYIPEEKKEDLELMTTASYGGVGSIIKKIDSLGVLITEPYAGSPAVKFGLQPGDVILKIDGADVKGLDANECSTRMKGQPDTEVAFIVKKGRTGKIEEIKLIRERIQIDNLSYYGILRDSIGYIRLDGFTVGLAKRFRKTFSTLKEQGIKRLVIDLRGNGGGILEESVSILSTLLPKGTKVVSQMGRDSSSLVLYKTTEEPVDTLMPVMVMVNSSSASASEILAGSLQDLDRATIAGLKTFGKGLVQTTVPVGYNGYMKYTIAKYYTPSGRCVQAIDYSNRNEDGSVGNIPDSLKRPFKTLKGRTVYDGGGITPDIEVKSIRYSRPLYSLVMSDVVGDYAIEYYKRHDSIAPADIFQLSDKEYEEFVAFAAKRDFDQRSTAEIEFESVITSSKEESIFNHYKEEMEALAKRLKNTKEQVLNLLKEEIRPVLEQEIVSKYYYTFGRMASIVKHDKMLYEALDKFN